MDSLYFNSHLPTANPINPITNETKKQVWPSVVTTALYGNDELDENELVEEQPLMPKSPPHLIDFGSPHAATTSPMSSFFATEPPQISSSPPPLPPKTRTNGKEFGGAKPKRKSSSSIVGKYLGNNEGVNGSLGSPMSSSLSPMASPGLGRRVSLPSSSLADKVKSSPTIKKKISFDLSGASPKGGIANSSFKSGRMLDIASEIDRQSAETSSMAMAADHSPSHMESGASDSFWKSPKLSHSKSFSSGDTYRPTVGASSLVSESFTQRALPKKPLNVEADMAEREKLREMLADLRKDPFDESLENNDGSFFPCEFCGDPYPVEFLMRHQVIKYVSINNNNS